MWYIKLVHKHDFQKPWGIKEQTEYKIWNTNHVFVVSFFFAGTVNFLKFGENKNTSWLVQVSFYRCDRFGK